MFRFHAYFQILWRRNLIRSWRGIRHAKSRAWLTAGTLNVEIYIIKVEFQSKTFSRFFKQFQVSSNQIIYARNIWQNIQKVIRHCELVKRCRCIILNLPNGRMYVRSIPTFSFLFICFWRKKFPSLILTIEF